MVQIKNMINLVIELTICGEPTTKTHIGAQK